MLSLTLEEGKNLVGILRDARHIALRKVGSPDCTAEDLIWKGIIFSALEKAMTGWDAWLPAFRRLGQEAKTVQFDLDDIELKTILEMLREDFARKSSRFSLVATPAELKKLTEKIYLAVRYA
jgi:hypothetical protein